MTQYACPGTEKSADLAVKIAPSGPIFDAEDFRRRYPAVRTGSDPTSANPEAGKKLVDTAVRCLVREFQMFAKG